MTWDARDDRESIKALTSWLLHKHYDENDVEAIINFMDDDIIWLGTADHEYEMGRDKVAAVFRGFTGKVPKCNISDELYDVLQLADGVYLCAGRLWVSTDPSTQIYLRVHQRISMVFRQTQQGFRCCHIHLSNPYEDMVEEDVGFPIRVANQTYQYLQEQVKVEKKQVAIQTALLKRMSYEDSLTGVFNRNKFNQYLETPLEGENRITGVACFDLNGLKEVNDQFGHSAGDTLICNAADQIRSVFPDNVFRTGGDEFVVIDHALDEASFRTAINEVQQKMVAQRISCSIGISWRSSHCNIREQYDEADGLMYQEKRQFYQTKHN